MKQSPRDFKTRSRPLRVMQVVGTYGGGGAQRQACNLVEALREQGLESWGLALRDLGDFARGSRHADRFRTLGISTRSWASLLPAAGRLRRMVRQLGIEVLHVHGSSGLPFIVASLWAMRSRPKIVFVWQDSGIVRAGRMPSKSEAWAMRRCDTLLASSQGVADWMRKVSGREDVGIFHGGVPERTGGSPISPPQILWVGRWVSDKDPGTMIRAASTLRDRGHRFRLIMVGAVTPQAAIYRRQMRELVVHLGLDDCVTVPDLVSDQDLDCLLSESSIGVQTSLTEGLSMALLEQMMAGLAIVATDVGDTKEALDGGRCGLLVQPRDEQQLSERLGEFLSDLQLRNRFRQAARHRACEYYSLDAMARHAARIYSAGGSPPSRFLGDAAEQDESLPTRELHACEPATSSSASGEQH